tara:strand:+ start:761 stop:919 length:159 start_codon:yes stop_codon:yes gene_type:complete
MWAVITILCFSTIDLMSIEGNVVFRGSSNSIGDRALFDRSMNAFAAVDSILV